MTSNIKSVSSPTHPIDFEFGDSPKQANVKLIIDEVRADNARSLLSLV